MEKFANYFNESKKIEFYEFSYTQRNMGTDSTRTIYVAISKGDKKEVEKEFKRKFSSFESFEKSSEQAFNHADVTDCYANTEALGRGMRPLYKKEGLEKISKN